MVPRMQISKHFDRFVLFIVIVISVFQILPKMDNFSQDYISNSPICANSMNIIIDGNNALSQAAGFYGWSGNGTKNSPFLIMNYDFENFSTGPILQFRNVDLFMIITNCTFKTTNIGIDFQNVSNAIIRQNSFNSHQYYALRLKDCSNLLIEENVIDNCNYGIFCKPVQNSTISNNIITRCKSTLLIGAYSRDILIFNNTFRNNEYGYEIEIYCPNIETISNVFVNISIELIKINSDGPIKFNNNTVIKGSRCIVIYSKLIGEFKHNNFIECPLFPIEPYNPQSCNLTVQDNYYSWYTYPDRESDGIVDIPYSFRGNFNDSRPRTQCYFEPKWSYLTPPMWVTNITDFRLNKTNYILILEWSPASHTWHLPVNYSLYYQIPNRSWTILAENVISPFSVNVRHLPRSNEISFKIVARSASNIIQESSEEFSINILIFEDNEENNPFLSVSLGVGAVISILGMLYYLKISRTQNLFSLDLYRAKTKMRFIFKHKKMIRQLETLNLDNNPRKYFILTSLIAESSEIMAKIFPIKKIKQRFLLECYKYWGETYAILQNHPELSDDLLIPISSKSSLNQILLQKLMKSGIQLLQINKNIDLFNQLVNFKNKLITRSSSRIELIRNLLEMGELHSIMIENEKDIEYAVKAINYFKLAGSICYLTAYRIDPTTKCLEKIIYNPPRNNNSYEYTFQEQFDLKNLYSNYLFEFPISQEFDNNLENRFGPEELITYRIFDKDDDQKLQLFLQQDQLKDAVKYLQSQQSDLLNFYEFIHIIDKIADVYLKLKVHGIAFSLIEDAMKIGYSLKNSNIIDKNFRKRVQFNRILKKYILLKKQISESKNKYSKQGNFVNIIGN
jgi:parallel beta-helix repeat protein